MSRRRVLLSSSSLSLGAVPAVVHSEALVWGQSNYVQDDRLNLFITTGASNSEGADPVPTTWAEAQALLEKYKGQGVVTAFMDWGAPE